MPLSIIRNYWKQKRAIEQEIERAEPERFILIEEFNLALNRSKLGTFLDQHTRRQRLAANQIIYGHCQDPEGHSIVFRNQLSEASIRNLFEYYKIGFPDIRTSPQEFFKADRNNIAPLTGENIAKLPRYSTALPTAILVNAFAMGMITGKAIRKGEGKLLLEFWQSVNALTAYAGPSNGPRYPKKRPQPKKTLPLWDWGLKPALLPVRA